MDGLFGLPRKKSAGRSHRPSLHGRLFFEDQEGVDQFVNEAQRRLSKHDANVGVCFSNRTSCIAHFSQECSDFLAGNYMCSAVRYKSLDETAHVDMSFLDDFLT